MTKKVLITGIAGFAGSHFLDHILENTDWEVVGIASWSHKGVPERITDSKYYQENKDRVTIFTHDLNAPVSKVLIDRIGYVDYIINLASMSHVNTSIKDPVPFIKNNINLELNVLELARDIWDLRKDGINVAPEGTKFIQFSTDEVYGPMLNNVPHPEWDPIIPSNPYSASKASQEAIAVSYWRTYGIPLIVTNTMNIIGERQDGEKFLPIIVNRLLSDETLTIHAQDGVIGSRFYLHARNAADAILFILNNVPAPSFPSVNEPERLNVVGKTELNNLELAEKVAKILDKKLKVEYIDVHSVRPGHDPAYGLDETKLNDYGYDYPVDFDSSLEKTVRWMAEPENRRFIDAL